MDPLRAFTEHPASVGETYTEHLMHAACFGARMVGAGIACMVHALLPFLFVRTGSQAVTELSERMITQRHARTQPIASNPRLPL